MVIATKVRWTMGGRADPKKPNGCGLSRKHILEAVEGSLKRLQTDYIDLYQVSNLYRNPLLTGHFCITQILKKYQNLVINHFKLIRSTMKILNLHFHRSNVGIVP